MTKKQFSIMKNPTGTYSFVGWGIPASLLFIYNDEKYLKAVTQCGLTIAQAIAKKEGGFIKTRTFKTEQDAQDAANKIDAL